MQTLKLGESLAHGVRLELAARRGGVPLQHVAGRPDLSFELPPSMPPAHVGRFRRLADALRGLFAPVTLPWARGPKEETKEGPTRGSAPALSLVAPPGLEALAAGLPEPEAAPVTLSPVAAPVAAGNTLATPAPVTLLSSPPSGPVMTIVNGRLVPSGLRRVS